MTQWTAMEGSEKDWKEIVADTNNKLTNCSPAMPFLLPTTTNAENDTLRPSVPVMFMTVLNYK